MARLVTYQTSFADGQISSKLKGFVDTESYKSSVQDLKNMVVMPQGSITRRPGTRYVAETSGNCSVRLIQFNFGQAQAYVLEFGEEIFTGATSGATTNKLVYATGGFTVRQHSLVGATVTNTTDSTTAYVKAVDSNSQLSLKDASGSDVDIFTSGENFSIAHAYVRFYKSNAQLLSGVNPYAVASPYSSSDLSDLSFTQSADILFIAHPSYQPRQLIRSGDTDWAFDYIHTEDGPYGPINTEDSALLKVDTTATSVEIGDPHLDITDNFFQLPNHDMLDGMVARMTLSGTAPTYHATDPTATTGGSNFTIDTDYYVVNATASTFQLSLTLNGRPLYLVTTGDDITIFKRIYKKASAITLKMADGTSRLWSYSGQSVTASSDSGLKFTAGSAHFLTAGNAVVFSASGLPGNITANTSYYVISGGLTSTVFYVSTEVGGSSVAYSSAGSSVIVHATGPKETIVTYTATSGSVTPSDGSTDLLFTDSSHGLVDDDRIQFRHASGSLPGGITESTNYYVKKLDANTFNISLTPSTSTNTTIDYDSSTGSNVSWYKDPIFYTCIATHTPTSTNNPGSALGNDYWRKLEINDGRGFEHYDVDTYLRYNPLQGASIQWGYVQVDSVTNGLTVTATVKEELVAKGPNHEWRKYVWNSNSGWPRAIEIFQQRLCFAGNNNFPQTVWFSKTGDYFKFSPSEKIGVASGNVSATGARVVGEQVKDDNAITLTISSATVDLIDWMISGKKLTVGTSGGVFQMYGSETELTITPFNFTIDRVTSYPTEYGASPLIIDNNVIYVQKNGRRMRGISYSTEAGGNQAADLTLRADDIALGELEDITYQDMPYNIVWGRMKNGKIVGLTYNKSLNMMAWSNHTLGGSHTDATYGNHAKVESITVIPTSTHNELWMVVKRTIDKGVVTANASTDKLALTGHGMTNGTKVRFTTTDEDLPAPLVIDTDYYVVSSATNDFKVSASSGGSAIDIADTGTGTHTVVMMEKRYVEYLDRFFDSGELTSDDAHFVDSGIYQSGGASTTLSGLTHLFGQTVRILADSALQTEQVVPSNGQLTIDSASKIHSGLGFDSYVTTLDLATGPQGVLVGNRKRIHRIVLKLLDTMGLKYGPRISELDEMIFRYPTDDLGVAVSYFTGDHVLTMGNMTYDDHHIVLGQDGPFPMSILLIGFDYESNDL